MSCDAHAALRAIALGAIQRRMHAVADVQCTLLAYTYGLHTSTCERTVQMWSLLNALCSGSGWCCCVCLQRCGMHWLRRGQFRVGGACIRILRTQLRSSR
jgi:hypothetical protein